MAFLTAIANWVLNTLAGVLGDAFKRTVMDWRSARTQITLQITIIAEMLPFLRISVHNKSETAPLHVHQVRICYGNKNYNHAFVCHPFVEMVAPPKAHVVYRFPHAGPFKVAKRLITETPQNVDLHLNLEHPRDFFRAIAQNDAQDSWIEIDFNDVRNHELHRGQVKCLFETMRDIANRSQPQQNDFKLSQTAT